MFDDPQRLGSQICYVLFYSFGFLRGLPPSSQINHTQRLILSYECLALAWLVSCQLFLNYPVYLLPLDFYLSLFFVYLYLLLSLWLAV